MSKNYRNLHWLVNRALYKRARCQSKRSRLLVELRRADEALAKAESELSSLSFKKDGQVYRCENDCCQKYLYCTVTGERCPHSQKFFIGHSRNLEKCPYYISPRSLKQMAADYLDYDPPETAEAKEIEDIEDDRGDPNDIKEGEEV